jgi:hypothetical protein
VSLPWLPHPSATANDVESISVKNETESVFMMLLFLGFHAGEISKNAIHSNIFGFCPNIGATLVAFCAF